MFPPIEHIHMEGIEVTLWSFTQVDGSVFTCYHFTTLMNEYNKQYPYIEPEIIEIY